MSLTNRLRHFRDAQLIDELVERLHNDNGRLSNHLARALGSLVEQKEITKRARAETSKARRFAESITNYDSITGRPIGIIPETDNCLYYTRGEDLATVEITERPVIEKNRYIHTEKVMCLSFDFIVNPDEAAMVPANHIANRMISQCKNQLADKIAEKLGQ